MAERLAEGARARLESTPSVVRALLEGMPAELERGGLRQF